MFPVLFQPARPRRVELCGMNFLFANGPLVLLSSMVFTQCRGLGMFGQAQLASETADGGRGRHSKARLLTPLDSNFCRDVGKLHLQQLL